MDFKAALIPENFPLTMQLCQRLQKPIVFLDLETTEPAPSYSTFGITQWAFISMNPNGQIYHQKSYVNPENPISPKAAEITGLTNAFCDSFDAFGRWTGLFRKVLSTALVSGFNSQGFDVPGLINQFARYGAELPSAIEQLDVRRVWTQHAKSQSGTLQAVCEHFGVEFNAEDAHDALYDVFKTAQLFENFLKEYGLTGILVYVDQFIKKPENVQGSFGLQYDRVSATTGATENAASNSREQANSSNALKIEACMRSLLEKEPNLAQQGYEAVNQKLLANSGVTPKSFSFALSDAIRANPELYAGALSEPSVQQWLETNAMGQYLEQKSVGLKLKPLLQWCQANGAPEQLDYIQLHLFNHKMSKAPEPTAGRSSLKM